MSIEREKNGHFVAGKSANPSGRAKVPPEVKEALRATCPKAVSTLIALLDDKKPIMRLKAACEILDRAYGKPIQMQYLSSKLCMRFFLGYFLMRNLIIYSSAPTS